jgi:hypothetical protein
MLLLIQQNEFALLLKKERKLMQLVLLLEAPRLKSVRLEMLEPNWVVD